MLSCLSKVSLFQFHDLGCKASRLHGTEVLQDPAGAKAHVTVTRVRTTQHESAIIHSEATHRHRRAACETAPAALSFCVASKQRRIAKERFEEDESNSVSDPAGFSQGAAAVAFAQGLQKRSKESRSSCGVEPRPCRPAAPAGEMRASGMPGRVGSSRLSSSFDKLLFPRTAFNGDFCLTRLPGLCCKMVLAENLQPASGSRGCPRGTPGQCVLTHQTQEDAEVRTALPDSPCAISHAFPQTVPRCHG